MGQLVTRPTGRDVKTNINPDYQTYGDENDVDYVEDFNGEYQASNYDEMDEGNCDSVFYVQFLVS